jgi:transcriptional/translational regulatory protein YebC/TACO1
MGTVSYNFEHVGIFGFEGTAELRDTIEETLILNDVDVREVSYEDNYIEVIVAPESFSTARDQLSECGVSEFDTAELTMLPNEKITLTGEDLEKFNQMLDMLDDVQDVQEVYHNVER